MRLLPSEAPARLPDQFVSPMLAVTQSAVFDDENWWYEVKWDGYRAMVSQTERLRVFSRRGQDLLTRFPELSRLDDQLPRSLVLDGEIIAWRDHHDSLERKTLPIGKAKGSLVFVAFDCLYAHNQWILDHPLMVRRTILEEAIARCPSILLAPGIGGRGIELLAEAHRLGLEGVVAKKKDSHYHPGKRSRLWQKFFVHEKKTLQAISAEPSGSGWKWALWDPIHQRVVAHVMAPETWKKTPWDALPAMLDPPVWCEVWFRSQDTQGTLRHARLSSWRND